MDGGTGEAIVLHLEATDRHYLDSLMREHDLSAQDMVAFLIRRAYLFKDRPAVPVDMPDIKPLLRSSLESSPRRKSARR